MASLTYAVFAFNFIQVLDPAAAHGRLYEPPSRASMWRLGYKTPPNYDDNQLFCGGFQVQYAGNGGKCGVCGDPWNLNPRPHEAGGSFATGTIVRKYAVSGSITVVVELTANHKGYFEFRLCPSDDPKAVKLQDCLNKYPLTSNTTGATRFHVPHGDYLTTQILRYDLQLPNGVKCRACMLQWKYNAGNSWGVDPDGTACVGCGDQEQFYGCSDIAIGYDDVVLGVSSMSFDYSVASTPSPVGPKVNSSENKDNMYTYCLHGTASSFYLGYLILISMGVFVEISAISNLM
ncbi:unnamed protein product [Lymnaea stagnalis]|uniref:Chitin-binding type-4 domain-containing protein n=1 Tax=Lymnaea stagnalis TaxID=6523 RepID=A0AAV2HI15_LYMST